MIDKIAFRSLSYGLYLVTAQDGEKQAGCVVNTFSQVTSSPAQASIAINKDNFTTGVITASGMFEVSVLAQDAPMELIGVAEHTVAHFCVKVKQTMDLGTHLYIMGEVVESAVLSSEEPMTYAYYHQVKGGKTPPKASSYEQPENAQEQKEESEGAAARTFAWRCTICGHIEYVDELPDDFVCPVCGVGKELFERIEL